MSAPVAEAGLIIDVAGAWALAMGFIAKRPEDMIEETAAKWGKRTASLRSLGEQKADAQVGAALLTLGFLGQFLASVGWSPHCATTSVMIPSAVVVALLGFAFLFCVWRPRTVRRIEALVPLPERAAS